MINLYKALKGLKLDVEIDMHIINNVHIDGGLLWDSTDNDVLKGDNPVSLPYAEMYLPGGFPMADICRSAVKHYGNVALFVTIEQYNKLRQYNPDEVYIPMERFIDPLLSECKVFIVGPIEAQL